MRQLKNLLLISAVILSACATPHLAYPPGEMYQRASALTKLSAAMEAHLRFGDPLLTLSESDLLRAGTGHDPALLANMGNFRLRVRSDERHAMLLMCSKDGTRLLLEDAGCTGALDLHHWDKPVRPCEFTLAAASICSKSNK